MGHIRFRLLQVDLVVSVRQFGAHDNSRLQIWHVLIFSEISGLNFLTCFKFSNLEVLLNMLLIAIIDITFEGGGSSLLYSQKYITCN